MIILNIHQIFGLSIEVYIINLILGIPVFFLLRRISRKLIKNDRIRKTIIWIATLICTPLIYIGLIILWISISSYYPTNDFNKIKWDTDKDKRYEMSDDLIKSKILIGKTKQDVIKILGNGDNNLESNTWYYGLGFAPRFMTIDPDVLIIEFTGEKVSEVRQLKK